eukprot:5518708-Amphidinium_carterae.1
MGTTIKVRQHLRAQCCQAFHHNSTTATCADNSKRLQINTRAICLRSKHMTNPTKKAAKYKVRR